MADIILNEEASWDYITSIAEDTAPLKDFNVKFQGFYVHDEETFSTVTEKVNVVGFPHGTSDQRFLADQSLKSLIALFSQSATLFTHVFGLPRSAFIKESSSSNVKLINDYERIFILDRSHFTALIRMNILHAASGKGKYNYHMIDCKIDAGTTSVDVDDSSIKRIISSTFSLTDDMKKGDLNNLISASEIKIMKREAHTIKTIDQYVYFLTKLATTKMHFPTITHENIFDKISESFIGKKLKDNEDKAGKRDILVRSILRTQFIPIYVPLNSSPTLAVNREAVIPKQVFPFVLSKNRLTLLFQDLGIKEEIAVVANKIKSAHEEYGTKISKSIVDDYNLIMSMNSDGDSDLSEREDGIMGAESDYISSALVSENEFSDA